MKHLKYLNNIELKQLGRKLETELKENERKLSDEKRASENGKKPKKKRLHAKLSFYFIQDYFETKTLT